MPRLKKTSVMLHEEELARKDRTLMAVIEKNRAIEGMTNAQLAKAAGMSYSTYMGLRKNPREFHRYQILALFEVLHVSDADKASVQW